MNHITHTHQFEYFEPALYQLILLIYHLLHNRPQKYTSFDLPVILRIKSTFPDGLMKPNWYAGHDDLHTLHIASSNLTVIEAGAFDWISFRKLKTISITVNSQIEYKTGMLNNLNYLETLSLQEDGAVARFGNKLLEPVARTLLWFYCTYVFARDGVHNFHDFVGDVKLSRLESLKVISMRRPEIQLAALGPNNFTGLKALQDMDIVSCGIVMIMENTFEYIGETLKRLDLTGNNLKIVRGDVFHPFLDSKKSLRLYSKFINLHSNPMECSCAFYALRNMTLISFGYTKYQLDIMKCRNSDANDIDDMHMTKCDTSQLIHSRRFHVANAGVDIYAYPRFQINLILKDTCLMIRQFSRGKYRLLIQNHNEPDDRKKTRCPNKWWMLESVHCLLLRDSIEKIPIAKYIRNSKLTTFCVIYVSAFKRIWPLHCTTIQRSDFVSEELSIWEPEHLPIAMMIVFAALIAGLIVGFSMAPSVTIFIKQKADSL